MIIASPPPPQAENKYHLSEPSICAQGLLLVVWGNGHFLGPLTATQEALYLEEEQAGPAGVGCGAFGEAPAGLGTSCVMGLLPLPPTAPY